ncbi:uncharacterized protein [Branchiostoma lanceolatum]|uniref:uncharacterized protein n=1 Tax=Branchiostoma lanceolatum TaxID=7740 RepID=UPI003455DBF7
MAAMDGGPATKKLKTSDSDALPLCPYGASCYRKNPQHFQEFRHPKDGETSQAVDRADLSAVASTSGLPPCKYGANCYRKNLLHFAQFSHPTMGGEPQDSDDTDTELAECEDEKASPLVKSDSDTTRLVKNYSKLTEEERRALIQRAVEAKKKLEEELQDTKKEVERKEKELQTLQQELSEGLLLLEGEKEALERSEVTKFPLVPERQYKEGSAAQVHFRLAESQFYRLIDAGSGYRVTKVEYVVSPEVVKRFRQAQKDLRDKRGEMLSYPVLAFHGTAQANIDPITSLGFKAPGESGFKHATDTGWYGKGVYFSEYPSYSMPYIKGGNRILLCQVLPGKVYQCSSLIHGSPLMKGSDSHTSPDKKELIIFNSHHILPCYILHYTHAHGDFKYKRSIKATKSVDELKKLYETAAKMPATKILTGLTFHLAGKLADKHSEIYNLIIKHGGKTATQQQLYVGVTLVAATSEMKLETPSVKVSLAENTQVPIVSEDFLYDRIITQQKKDVSDYVFS